MNLKQLKKCLKICKINMRLNILVMRISKNIRKISKTGVDRISVGSITHSAKSFDVSLELSS